MANKPEQKFCTELADHLKMTKYPNTAFIEVKVADGDRFNLGSIRKSQFATLTKIIRGIPVHHKISDGSAGSKFVDLIYVNPIGRVEALVAVKFNKSKRVYLLPFDAISGLVMMGRKKLSEDVMDEFEIVMRKNKKAPTVKTKSRSKKKNT